MAKSMEGFFHVFPGSYDINLDDFEGWKGYDLFCHKHQEISTCFASAMLVSEIHEISK